jgi:hypothetical protein
MVDQGAADIAAIDVQLADRELLTRVSPFLWPVGRSMRSSS